jgi:energy-coupling factor transporter ATP-binding protein EcfA2
MGRKSNHPDEDDRSGRDLAEVFNERAPVSQQPDVNTWGGAFVSGDVTAGKFFGRDKNVITKETAYNIAGLPNPYLGLSAFSYADRAAFGGRETSIRAAVKKMTTPGSQQTLLFITGTSGSGKSSFAQAGLLPALEDYYQERHKQVARAVFRPASDPLAMLADALGLLGLPKLPPQKLERFTPSEFSRFLVEHTPQDQVNLLVIDQFEEFFTQSSAAGREIALNFLANLAGFQEIHTHVLVTLRSDFLQELFNHPALWNTAKQGVELRAMTTEELNIAIQQPLWNVQTHPSYQGKRFKPALLKYLAQAASQEAAYLPLLQTTLQELWNRGRLTLGEYKGLVAAIRRRAEIIYKYADYDASQPEKERPPSDQEAILGIFLDLVNVCLDDDPGRDMRRRREKAKLVGQDPQRKRLVDNLIQARLLSAGREVSGKDELETVDIIHESLIMNWGRLQGAIAEKRQTLRQRAVIEQQMGEWLASERSNEYALTGVHLAEARELDIQGDIALRGVDAQAFLRRSSDLAEAAQRRRVRIISLLAASLSLLLLVAMIATGFAW